MTSPATPADLRVLADAIVARIHEAFLAVPDELDGHLRKAIRRLPGWRASLPELVRDLDASEGHRGAAAARILGALGPTAARPDVLGALARRIPKSRDVLRVLSAMGPSAASPEILDALFQQLGERTPHGVDTTLAELSDAFVDTDWMDRLWPAVLTSGGVSYSHAVTLGRIATKHPRAPRIMRIRDELVDRLLGPATARQPVTLTALAWFGAAADARMVDALVAIAPEARSPWIDSPLAGCLASSAEACAKNPAAREVVLDLLNQGDPHASHIVHRMAPALAIEERARVSDALLRYLSTATPSSVDTSFSLTPESLHTHVEAGRALAVLGAAAAPERCLSCLALLEASDDHGRRGAIAALTSPIAPALQERALRALASALLRDSDSDVRCAAGRALVYHAQLADAFPFLVDAAATIVCRRLVLGDVRTIRDPYRAPTYDIDAVVRALDDLRVTRAEPALYEEKTLLAERSPDELDGTREFVERVGRLSEIPSQVVEAAADALGAMSRVARRRTEVIKALSDLATDLTSYVSASAAVAALRVMNAGNLNDFRRLFDFAYEHMDTPHREHAYILARLHRLGLRRVTWPFGPVIDTHRPIPASAPSAP